MIELKSYGYGPKAGGAPQSLVVLLHGLGADGRDLIGLAPYFAGSLPHTLFVSPDAPFPCDMAPYGRQWFSLQSWSHDSILKGIQEAAPILNHFIDTVLEQYSLDDSRLALAGFSQGTMMSLYAGPRRKKRIAGILGYSGALVWEEGFDSTALQKPPVCLIHGDADTVVPPLSYSKARQALEKNGFQVSGNLTKGLAHGIDEDGIEAGSAFLKTVLTVENNK